jgi:hypothetical protein
MGRASAKQSEPLAAATTTCEAAADPQGLLKFIEEFIF